MANGRPSGALTVLTGLLTLRNGFNLETLSADLVLRRTAEQVHRLDPDGAARNVDLPAGGEDGRAYVFINVGAGAEDLTIRNPAGGTVATVTPTDLGIVAYTGGSWQLIALIAGVVS